MLKLLVALAGILLSTSSFANFTYNYTTTNYFTGNPPYTTAMSVTGSITTGNPLPANVSTLTDFGPYASGNSVQGWNFNDGVNSFTQTNSTLLQFKVTTDAGGNIVQFEVFVESPSAPHTLGQTLNVILVEGQGNAAGTLAGIGVVCNALSPSSSACQGWHSPNTARTAYALPGSWTVTAPLATAPALELRQLAWLAMLLGAIGAVWAGRGRWQRWGT